ncbi:MAG: preprotein translocase subunit TatB [Rhodocyclaceae bacterium]
MTEQASLLERIAAAPHQQDADAALLADLVAWLRPRPRERGAGSINARLGSLLQVLRGQPQLAAGLRDYVSDQLAQRRHRFLYAGSGILDNSGFFTALRRRLSDRLLPPALDHRFLGDMLEEVFCMQDDPAWLAQIAPDLWDELIDVIGFGADAPHAGRRRVVLELVDALRIVACRLAALGLEPDLVRYHAPLAQYESPFLALQREIDAHTEGLLASDLAEAAVDLAHAQVLAAQCADALERIRRQSRESGAAVNLSWHLTRAAQMIDRAVLLMSLLTPQPEHERRTRALAFFLTLVRNECRRNSVRDLFGSLFSLLALQVTEHASKTGEHYVTRDRAEFWQMFRAAAGAGVIVAFMALIKVFIGDLHLAPVWQAVGFSLNYGLGFVLIHVLGFTIATKQPAMTAATLAAALEPRPGSPRGPLLVLTELIVQVVRSQLIAIVGNVIVAFAVSLAVAWAWVAAFGAPAVSADKATHLLQDLHPWRSLALPHAAIAGCCLFLAGLISGYYDNKAIYNRVPERLLRVGWLRRLLGERRLARLSDYVEHNLGALAGNFLFGCMLGCMGTVGFLLGLPLDIRHVTFAAANLAYGSQAAAVWPGWHVLVALALGVLLIGATNLAVSFALALRVALKSRGIRFAERSELAGLLWGRLRSRPRDFVWPPPDATADVANAQGADGKRPDVRDGA